MVEPELGTRTWSRSSTKFDVKGFQSISWKILKSKKSKSDLKILSQRFHIHIIKSIYPTDGMVHVQFHWISAIFSRVIKIFSFSALSRKSLKLWVWRVKSVLIKNLNAPGAGKVIWWNLTTFKVLVNFAHANFFWWNGSNLWWNRSSLKIFMRN